MARLALEAISQEEDAAASIGIDVTRTKLSVTLISALMTCVGGVLYAQYQLYVNPETVSGIGDLAADGVRRRSPAACSCGSGRRSARCSRCCSPKACGSPSATTSTALDTTIYGLLLVLFIIFMPKGILGTVMSALRRRRQGR